MMFYCKLAFPLSEREWCVAPLFVALCHTISLHSTEVSVQLWAVKQFSPSNSSIATPAAECSLTFESHFPVFLDAFLVCAVIIIPLWWRDAAASILKP